MGTPSLAPSQRGVSRAGDGSSPVTMHFDLHDYHVALSVPHDAARASAMRIFGGFGPLPTALSPAPARYTLLRSRDAHWEVNARDCVRHRISTLSDALGALEWHLVTDMLDALRDCFHLHCAALADPSMSASLLVVGVSGSGKTTLTLGLMAHGFVPYSDDVTLIDPDRCAPTVFPRAFHVDARARDLLRVLPPLPHVDCDSLAGYGFVSRWATAPLPIRTVLFPTLAPGRDPGLVLLSRADAITRLLPYSATLTHSPSLALRIAKHIVEQARCYALTTGSLDTTVWRVREQMERDRATCG